MTPDEPDLDEIDEPDVDELARLAGGLAQEAGVLVRDGRRGGIHDARSKSSPTDVATEWDRASEELLVTHIRASRPHDAIVAEEGSSTTGDSGISWLIDPIDGTTNYVYDLPLYGISVAACDALGPLVGAVYVPVTHELFTAIRGRGAERNGRPIRCSSQSDVSQALVGTGFSYLAARRAEQLVRLQRVLPAVRDIRRLGAASVDLCYVAMGRLDAYYEEGLSPWDLAAGQLVATEAGATLRAIDHGPVRPDSVLAAAPGVFDALQNLLVGGKPSGLPGIM